MRRAFMTRLVVASGLSYAVMMGCGSLKPSPGGEEPEAPPMRADRHLLATSPSPSTSPKPSPTPIWVGDFETAGQWNRVDTEGASGPTLVTDRVRQGKYALRFDMPAGGLRNEVALNSLDHLRRFTQGEEHYFGFSLYFDPNWPTAQNWQVVAQWKQEGDGTPPLQVSAEGNQLKLRGKWYQSDAYKSVNLGSYGIPRGKWTDFVVRVKFSPYLTVGFVEAWRDGVKVVEKTPWETMQGGRTFSYLKCGLYRDTATPGTTSIWHDGWRMGNTYDDAVVR